MLISCGPDDDKITFEFKLPYLPKKIGVLISGGIDSAILYYLMLKENLNLDLGKKHTILPFTIERDDQVKFLAQAVIDQIHESLKLPKVKTTMVSLPGMNDSIMVFEGFKSVLEQTDMVYMGIIKQMPEHTDPAFLLPKYLRPSRYLRLPLRKLNKSHIIDLCYKFKQENLFHVTNACDFNAIGRCNDCLGCAERSWGFLKNNKQDPGRI